VSNIGIRERLQRHRSVVGIIARRKLQLFGPICKMDDDRLIKRVMLDMVDGNRARGRPPRRWVDDIINWGGCSFPAAVHLTANKELRNKKIDDAVAGLDGPPWLWVSGWIDEWMVHNHDCIKKFTPYLRKLEHAIQQNITGNRSGKNLYRIFVFRCACAGSWKWTDKMDKICTIF